MHRHHLENFGRTGASLSQDQYCPSAALLPISPLLLLVRSAWLGFQIEKVYAPLKAKIVFDSEMYSPN